MKNSWKKLLKVSVVIFVTVAVVIIGAAVVIGIVWIFLFVDDAYKRIECATKILTLVGGFVGIYFVATRTFQTAKQIQLRQANNVNNDFTCAVELLDNMGESTRIGALIALHFLAMENEKIPLSNYRHNCRAHTG